MLKKIFWIFIFFVVFCSQIFAAIPNYISFVNDYYGALSAENKLKLEALSAELEQKTKVELVTAIVTSLDDDTIDNYAIKMVEKWRIGKKKENNGLLFLIAPNNRGVRIEVGYGLEGIIPDGKAGEILDQNVLPAFRQGKLEEGIMGGHIALAQIIAENYNVELSGVVLNLDQKSSQGNYEITSLLAPLVQFFIFMIILLIFSRGRIWPLLLFMLLGGSGRGGGFGSFGGQGGFGGFGGGLSGGGGSSRGW